MSDLNNAVRSRFAGAADRVRPDLQIDDYQLLDERTARIACSFSGPVPTGSQFDRWAVATFEGRIRGVSASYAVDEANQRFIALVNTIPVSRPAADRTAMLKINPVLFSERSTGSLWELEKRESGEFLVRRDAAKLSDALDSEFERQASGRGRGSCSNYLSNSVKSQPLIVEGDTVQYYHGGGTRTGVVKQLLRTVVIENRVTGQTDEVPMTSVFSIVQRAAQTETERQKHLFDYYSKIYGSEFAAQMLGMDAPAPAVAPTPHPSL